MRFAPARAWPWRTGFAIAAGGWLVLTAASFAAALGAAHGELVYPLDDAYIHLSIARHLCQFGVWGVSAHAFAAASSSPTWTLLLASCIWLFGVHAWVALLLACAAAVALCACVARALSGCHGVLSREFAPLAIICLLPAHVLTLSGMEHVLQSALAVALAARTLELLAPAGARPGLRALTRLGPLAAVLVATRYESACVVAACAALLAWRGAWLGACGLLGCGLLPVMMFGAFSMAHGGPWLPSSILAKASVLAQADATSAVPAIWRNFTLNLAEGPHVPALLVASFGLAALGVGIERDAFRARYALALAALANLLHLAFARVGWFYRYEAYLIGLTLVAVVHVIDSRAWRSGRARIPIVVCSALLPLSLLPRAWDASLALPQAVRSVYGQQLQMARFAAAHYAHRSVVANDIGALTFFVELDVIDAWGLANWSVLREARRPGGDPAKLIDRLARERRAKWAVTYYPVGPAWTLVASWTEEHPVSVASGTVSFSAPDLASAAELRANLKAFEPRLPRGVSARYFIPGEP